MKDAGLNLRKWNSNSISLMKQISKAQSTADGNRPVAKLMGPLSEEEESYSKSSVGLLYVTIFWKIDHLRGSTEIHFLPVQERYIHALSRNTNCLTIDGQVCFYRRLFTNAVKPRGCISRSWGTLIGLHGVPNCSSRQSWPPLWIVSVHVIY